MAKIALGFGNSGPAEAAYSRIIHLRIGRASCIDRIQTKEPFVQRAEQPGPIQSDENEPRIWLLIVPGHNVRFVRNYRQRFNLQYVHSENTHT